MNDRPIDVVTAALARAGCGDLRGDPASDNGAMIRCPAHDDRTPSLKVTEKPDGTVLLCCHAGCDTNTAVLPALGLSMMDLFPAKTGRGDEIDATYEYETTPKMQVVRRTGKRFHQERLEGDQWVKGGVPRKALVIYRRASVLAEAALGGDVIVVEGEKDADRLRSDGFIATTNPMGTGMWLDRYAQDFEGASKVIVVADKDEPGHNHARQVAESLRSVVDDVVVVEALVGKDVSDHLAAGHGVDELVPIGEGDPARDDDDEFIVPLINWAQVHDPGDDVVEGLAMYGRWTQFVASPKVGKSSLLVFMAIELSEGRDPFDGTPRDPVEFLYCDGEMGRLDLEELIRACGHDPVKLNLPATTERMRLDTEMGAERLLRRVDRLGSRGVLLDGLNGFVDPAASENTDNTWRPLVRYTVDPLKSRGITILSADNYGKDPKLGSRGSSVKTDKADGVIQVGRTDNGVRLHVTHSRGGAYLTADLNLDAEGFDRSRPIRFRRAFGGWPAGTAVVAAMLDSLGVPLDDGRTKVRARLNDEIDAAKAAGGDGSQFRAGNEVLNAALRYRRNPVVNPATVAP